MIFLIFLIILLIITVFIIYSIKYNNYKKSNEHFNETNCSNIYKKDGMICQITPSPLFPPRCFRVKKTKKNPYGYYEIAGNEVDCSLYGLHPDCQDVSIACDAPNIFKLEQGYVDLYP